MRSYLFGPPGIVAAGLHNSPCVHIARSARWIGNKGKQLVTRAGKVLKQRASTVASASPDGDVRSADSAAGVCTSTMPRQVDGSDSLPTVSASSATCASLVMIKACASEVHVCRLMSGCDVSWMCQPCICPRDSA